MNVVYFRAMLIISFDASITCLKIFLFVKKLETYVLETRIISFIYTLKSSKSSISEIRIVCCKYTHICFKITRNIYFRDKEYLFDSDENENFFSQSTRNSSA